MIRAMAFVIVCALLWTAVVITVSYLLGNPWWLVYLAFVSGLLVGVKSFSYAMGRKGHQAPPSEGERPNRPVDR